MSSDAWENLVESAVAVGRRGNTREALVLLHGGIEAARRAGVKRGEIIALNGAALVHSIRGDYWASLAGSIDAFFLAMRENDRLGMATAMTMLAGALSLMTPVESEVDMLGTALVMSEEEGSLKLQTRVHNLLGIVLGDLERFDEAELHLDMAMVLSASESAGFDRWRLVANQANLLRKRAQAARARGAMAECAEYAESGKALLNRAEIHCREQGKMPILLDVLGVSGLIDLQLDDRVAAGLRFTAAWDLAISRKHRSVLPFLGLEIGKLEQKSGRLDTVEPFIAEALREAALYRPSPKASALCGLMAAMQHARGDECGAAHWHGEGANAAAEFEKLKSEARQQMARVTESLAV